jgi:enterochelin esterase-like enzyme
VDAVYRRRYCRAMLRTLPLLAIAATALAADADYTLGPDSQPQPGVPQGEVKKFTFAGSKIFPGTTREWALYVPKQYDGSKPACAMIFFDGPGYLKADGNIRATVVMDNLIAKKEMPVTVGIFVSPGSVKATAPGGKDRSNRSFEYDSLGDANAKFVLDELLPLVSEQGVKLTEDPAGWAACGLSSSGIAAFTLAWERPDKFGKVVSWIGSFTNIRGGYVYPALIRKTKPAKPIRVFLQDGSADLDNLHGNWPLSNQDMAAALKFAGYDHKFEFGTGGHSPKHGAAIFPDTLRWLWRDFPK